MTENYKPFVKKVCKSGSGYLLWIPKDVMKRLSLEKDSMAHVRIRKVGQNE